MKFIKFLVVTPFLFALPITFTLQKRNVPSALTAMAQGETVGRNSLIQYFTQDCIRDTPQNKLIPLKKKETVRIATYNIHGWRAPFDHFSTPCDFMNNENFNTVLQTIKNINADIIIVQEMLIFNWSIIKNNLEALGYHCTLNSLVQSATYHNYPFGTMILSKYPSPSSVRKTYNTQLLSSSDRQGFIKTTLELPHHQKLVVYGTHLDVRDETEQTRYEQVQELLTYAAQEESPCIVAADFNAIRRQDYEYTIGDNTAWDLINNDHLRRAGLPTPTKALELFKENNFTDCFSKAGQSAPYYSVWNGTLVDFIWINKQWNLPLEGCYVYYSTASDHLPIIMDIRIE